jgi:hypothetical protein
MIATVSFQEPPTTAETQNLTQMRQLDNKRIHSCFRMHNIAIGQAAAGFGRVGVFEGAVFGASLACLSEMYVGAEAYLYSKRAIPKVMRPGRRLWQRNWGLRE